MSKVILDLCGGTGSWSRPYKEAGYDVRLITYPDHDVLTYTPPKNVYGILAAPPCTMFSLAGNKYRAEEKRNHTYIPKLIDGLKIVQACLNIVRQCNPKFWALENPVGTLSAFLGDPVMMFDPCDFGDPHTKRTALWGKFSYLVPKIVKPEFVLVGESQKKMSPIHNSVGGSSDRTKEIRSTTPSGFAQAFFEGNQ